MPPSATTNQQPSSQAAVALEALAVVLQEPGRISLERLELTPPTDEDVVIDIEWSGISTGTERLLWSGKMPPFPGLGYPLVPGYESVGLVRAAGTSSGLGVGDRVFVPGARCFGPVRGLFGGAASRVVVAGSRVVPVAPDLGERAILMALAATAQHALSILDGAAVDLIVGHGVLGRLIARAAMASGAPAPVVWETNPARRSGAEGYTVVNPADDARRDYRAIVDVSGDASLLDTLIARLCHGGAIVLAGFYSDPLTFSFPPAFLREAQILIAAEWRPKDLAEVKSLIDTGCLSLDGLITHHRVPNAADEAYRVAFSDPSCLKMILDWRGLQ
jgi:3-hydroxyethyl bacteriochlorophyllide a dehydrogenase